MQQLTQDSDYAKAIQDALVPILAGHDFPDLPVIIEDENGAEANVVETFEEAGTVTRDSGLVLHMSDGSQVRLTIQAYVPAKAQR